MDRRIRNKSTKYEGDVCTEETSLYFRVCVCENEEGNETSIIIYGY